MSNNKKNNKEVDNLAVNAPIPKPSNNWLEEFDVNVPSARANKRNTSFDLTELPKRPLHEKYASDKGKFRRR